MPTMGNVRSLGCSSLRWGTFGERCVGCDIYLRPYNKIKRVEQWVPFERDHSWIRTDAQRREAAMRQTVEEHKP